MGKKGKNKMLPPPRPEVNHQVSLLERLNLDASDLEPQEAKRTLRELVYRLNEQFLRRCIEADRADGSSELSTRVVDGTWRSDSQSDAVELLMANDPFIKFVAHHMDEIFHEKCCGYSNLFRAAATQLPGPVPHGSLVPGPLDRGEQSIRLQQQMQQAGKGGCKGPPDHYPARAYPGQSQQQSPHWYPQQQAALNSCYEPHHSPHWHQQQEAALNSRYPDQSQQQSPHWHPQQQAALNSCYEPHHSPHWHQQQAVAMNSQYPDQSHQQSPHWHPQQQATLSPVYEPHHKPYWHQQDVAQNSRYPGQSQQQSPHWRPQQQAALNSCYEPHHSPHWHQQQQSPHWHPQQQAAQNSCYEPRQASRHPMGPTLKGMQRGSELPTSVPVPVGALRPREPLEKGEKCTRRQQVVRPDVSKGGPLISQPVALEKDLNRLKICNAPLRVSTGPRSGRYEQSCGPESVDRFE
eukprot:TRINITY_DN2617_c0_g1_i6.p1 TRINITY_DN2617_c0_g1~~TRINITY_DN2617_c0_g1_i6.p1  ORF type:complete len:463 (+),score=70.51 TRINITY_DN2617_c0_g1_i6:76-1464(+)